MDELKKSASKIVFLMVALTSCVGFLLGCVFRFFNPDTTAGLPVDQFMLLATGAFAFYFANKGEAGKDHAGK